MSGRRFHHGRLLGGNDSNTTPIATGPDFIAARQGGHTVLLPEPTKRPKGKRSALSNGVEATAWAMAEEMVEKKPSLPFMLIQARVLDEFYFATADRIGMIEQVLPRWIDVHESDRLSALPRSLPDSALVPEGFGWAQEALGGIAIEDGHLVQKSKGAAHYTPYAMADEIVRKTLDPLYNCGVSPDQTLSLRICDPCVGGGVFLIAAVRQLGQRAFDAGLAKTLDEAKRLVAIHCLYGTDVDPISVIVAQRALRLECHAGRMPLDWLNGNIKHGDALVGLTEEQFKAFHWAKGKAEDPVLAKLFDEAMRAGAAARTFQMELLSEAARTDQ